MNSDEKLEAYLRQFRARAPGPLPARNQHVIFRRIAGIAAVAAVILLALFFSRGWRQQSGGSSETTVRDTEPFAKEISFVRLSQLARQEPDKLDSRLNKLSTELLPDVRASHGILKQLARE